MVVGYSVGAGKLDEFNNFLAINGSAIVTSHLHYNPLESHDGFGLLNPYDFDCYYELNWFVRDTWLTQCRSTHPVYRTSNIVKLDGSEWKHSRIVGMLPARTPLVNFVKLDYVLNSGILAYNDVRWSLYTARTPAIPGSVMGGPTKFPGETATVDPWLGHTTTGKRDDEELGPVTVVEDVETVPAETAPVETTPTPQVVPGPAFAFYRLVARFPGDAHYYMLYKTMVLRYAGANYGLSWSVYQYDATQARVQLTLQASDGVGVLSLPASGPVFGDGSGQTRGVAYEIVGAAIIFKSEDGKYLAWSNTPSLGGGVEGSGASYQLGYTDSADSALQFALNATS